MRAVSFFGSARREGECGKFPGSTAAGAGSEVLTPGEPLAGGRAGKLIRTVSLPGEFSAGRAGSVMRTVSFFGSFNANYLR